MYEYLSTHHTVMTVMISSVHWYALAQSYNVQKLTSAVEF